MMTRAQLEFNVRETMSSWLASNQTLVFITTIIFVAMIRRARFTWFKDRLPVFTFHYKVKLDGETVNVPYCCVCLNEAEDGERLRRLPRCKHCFHVDCIDAWFQYRSTCPLCRNEVSIRRPQNQRGLLASIVFSLLHNIFRKMCSSAPPLNFTTTLIGVD
ncbi:hypothetical protein PTKIN_Ptkin01aG0275900 [Pterospermum kingtungense]